MSTIFESIESTLKQQPEKKQTNLSTESQALLDLLHATKKESTDNLCLNTASGQLDFGPASKLYNDNLFPESGRSGDRTDARSAMPAPVSGPKNEVAVGAAVTADAGANSSGSSGDMTKGPGPAQHDPASHEAAHPFTSSEITAGGGTPQETAASGYKSEGGMGVQQSGYGDCWFEASVAALASTPEGAQTIANSIKANPDGGYTVTFQGDKDHPINVTKQDLQDPKINPNEAEWAKVLEAANAKRDPDHAKNGGYSADAYKLLTGKDATEEAVHTDGAWWNPFDNGHDSLGDIQNAIKDGKGVTVSTGDHSKDDPIVGGHEYQVVSADGNNVILRNPWGTNSIDGLQVGQTKNGVTDLGNGEIQVSYDTFRKEFQTVDIAQA